MDAPTAGQILSSFDWALVVGGAGLLAFFVRRFVTTMDKLDAALNELRLTLAEEYVTKQDLKEFREEIRDMLRLRFERVESMCANDESCPVREMIRKEPQT